MRNPIFLTTILFVALFVLPALAASIPLAGAQQSVGSMSISPTTTIVPAFSTSLTGVGSTMPDKSCRTKCPPMPGQTY